ncbi:hypothetical protein PI125_g14208 [Phytophthora idaei]|nr:hypothetical protein PI125_g14208 [Phytophthora idaei]
MIDDAARDGAHTPTPTLAADRERIGMANDTEKKSNAVARERGDGTADDQVLAVDNDQALEMLMIMRGLAGRLERLEESQSKLEKKLDDEEKRVRAVDLPMTLKPLRVGLGCGARTHIDSLARSPQTPLTTTPRRPAAPPQYFGQHQPGYGVPLSELQRLFAAAQGAQCNGVTRTWLHVATWLHGGFSNVGVRHTNGYTLQTAGLYAFRLPIGR